MKSKTYFGLLLLVLVALALGAKTVRSLVHRGCGGVIGKKDGKGTANWCFGCNGRVPSDQIVES